MNEEKYKKCSLCRNPLNFAVLREGAFKFMCVVCWGFGNSITFCQRCECLFDTTDENPEDHYKICWEGSTE